MDSADCSNCHGWSFEQLKNISTNVFNYIKIFKKYEKLLTMTFKGIICEYCSGTGRMPIPLSEVLND